MSDDKDLTCAECGEPMIINADGTANHVLQEKNNPDQGPTIDDLDYDVDADHVPYTDEDNQEPPDNPGRPAFTQQQCHQASDDRIALALNRQDLYLGTEDLINDLNQAKAQFQAQGGRDLADKIDDLEILRSIIENG